MDRALVTFEDVAIYFTRGEWERLNEEQKSLYKEVMNDNYQMILSLNRPDIILNIDLGYEPYVHSHSDSDGAGSWQENNRKNGSSSQPSCPEVISSRCEPQVKRQRRYPRVNPFRWIKKDKKKKKRFSHSSHRISRRAEDKRTLSGDYAVKTFPKSRHHDSSTCISQDSTNNIQDDPPLHDEPIRGSKNLNSEEDSDDETAAECSHHLGEAVGTCEKQEDVLERSSLTRDKTFTAGMKNCEKPTKDLGLSPNLDSSHTEDDIDLALNGEISDSKDIPVSEISGSLIKANSEGPRKMGTPKTETQKEERRSSTTKKKESYHKKDRHVKFNEVVTMILIEQKSEEQSSKSLEGGVKLQSTRLPIFNSVNEEGSKKKAEKRTTRHDIEEGRASQVQSVLHRNVEGTKQRRKRSIVSSSQAEEVESCHSDPTKCSKKRIVKVMGTSLRAPELEALSPSKKNIKERHELHNVEMNDSKNFKETYHSNMKSEDGQVDTGSGPQPNPILNNNHQKSIKSYSCYSCGKVTHWSKLSIHQKESIEKSIAIMCRMCALQTSSTSATAPAQTICPLSFTTHPRSSDISQPINLSKKILACSSAQPNTERILSTEKKQTQHKDGRKETTTENPGSLDAANDQKMGTNTDHYKKALQTSQDSNESKVCSKCRNIGASLDPKMKTFTASPANKTSTADTLPPGLDSSCNRIGIKDKKVASKSVEQPKKTGDCRDYVVCAKCGECFGTKQKNDPSSHGQQKKLTKSTSLLQKTQEQVLKTCPSYINNIRNPSCIVDHESPKSDKDSTKCGKSLASHVTANPENSDESSEKNGVLHLKKKRKQLLEEMEPFQCKQCGSIFTCHLTLLQHRIVHIGERPYSCKECGQCFQDSEYLKSHMKLHTKEKLKSFTGSSVNNTSTADTSSSGQDSNCSRIGMKDKKVAFKSSVQLPRQTQDNKEHEGCAKYREYSMTEPRNDPSSSDQQQKPTKSSPSMLQKRQDHSRISLKTHSTYIKNIKNPRRVKEPEDPKSDKKCAKCGKSLAKHVNLENPSEGACILRLTKKRKRPLEGMEPFQCKKCEKTFTRHFSLMQHRTVHTGERPFSCKECGKSFRDGGYLKVHMRLHTKEKPYTCPECGKLFGQHSALAVHLRTHTDERPFQCNVCGKSFGDRSTFRHHQMIHTGEKPFTCSFCGKKFTQQAHVKRHEKMHTGERPFGCTMCEKRFIDRTKLRKHELTHNREKV
ncbi:zinc finger protein 850-like [Eleutherodactylus coqui]|uniref:zinc finger protein 850-like n=1 Tax=Eleutherodactylus coqui TaxID=57060 RepID=UPI003461C12D